MTIESFRDGTSIPGPTFIPLNYRAMLIGVLQMAVEFVGKT